MRRIIVSVVAVLVSAVILLLGYTLVALPNVGPAPDLKVERSPERVARGRYLANSVLVCMDCHSSRDWSRFSGPLVPGTLGRGGERFDQSFGFPGVYFARNITPAGIRDWSDGELFRLITTGVRKDGTAIFPVMPYPYYGRLDPEDVKDVIAYLRSLAPIENHVPESRSDFPMSVIIKTIPAPAQPRKRPDRANQVAYGEYLTMAAACVECHTKEERGRILPELSFSGGRAFPLPDGSIIRSANITPHAPTGIGGMTRQGFVAIFRTRGAEAQKSPAGYQTMMPWSMYGTMTTQDLEAIYDYLQTVKPIENRVERFTAGKR